MKTGKMALLALAGISYIFLSRILATLLPGLFGGPFRAGLHLIVSFLASLTVLFFYVYFRRYYLKSSETVLDKASVIRIIGASAVSLLYLKAFFILRGRSVMYSVSFDLFIPWVDSIISLYFFYVFYRYGLSEGRAGLKTALMLAVAGSASLVLIRTAVMINYLYQQESVWLWDHIREHPFIFLPVQVFIFFTAFYFYFTFYREQRAGESA